MATLEMVEKLKERAGVSYEEAKHALEQSNDDMLDAMIYLEKQGKVNPPKNDGRFTTRREAQNEQAEPDANADEDSGQTAGQVLSRFFNWILRLIKKGNENSFEIWHKGTRKLNMPITVMVLLVVFCFWITIPLIIIGLFCGCKYSFRGPNVDKTGVNSVMDSAAKAAENLKSEVLSGDDKNNGGEESGSGQ